MNKKTILTATALAGILSLAANTARAEHPHPKADPAMTEKCYGVAKMGKNDCGANAHSCAGHAAKDGDPAEWLMVPTGLCDKLVGGSLTAPMAEPEMKTEEKKM